MIRTLVMAGAALSIAGAALAAPQSSTHAKPGAVIAANAPARHKLDCKLEKNKLKKACKAEEAAAAAASAKTSTSTAKH